MKGITKGEWATDGEHVVSILSQNEDFLNQNNTETICDINPVTEYPTVFERSFEESFSNARLICTAGNLTNAGYNIEAMPQLVEALEEVKLQIEYLHQKFSETGSGNAVLTKIEEALKSAKL